MPADIDRSRVPLPHEKGRLRGEAQLLDLRTELERRRYGWPPGAPRVSLTRHVAWPGSVDTIYLCQHANRSKLTAWRGAAEVAGGWPAW